MVRPAEALTHVIDRQLGLVLPPSDEVRPGQGLHPVTQEAVDRSVEPCRSEAERTGQTGNGEVLAAPAEAGPTR